MTGGTTTTPAAPSRSVLPLLALLLLTAIRLVVAAHAPLSPDEAYYWTWSHALAPGYLDHPPMVALWIRLGTALAGETALGVRLLAPLAAALGTVLLARTGDALFPGRGAGLRAAILLNATLLFGVGAVTMTPDTPLLFFWTAAIWALARIAAGARPQTWLVVGAAAGLALDSKYTAALLGLGIAGWLFTPAMRPRLRTPWPWAGGAVALLLFLPVVQWNAAHGWVSFLKQGGRTADFDPARALRFVAELLGGQAALMTPLIAVLFVAGTAACLRRWRDPPSGLAASLVLPAAAVFVQHALGDRVQANWVAILYPGAALAAAAPHRLFRLIPWRVAAGLGFALTALLYLQTVAPLPLPPGIDPMRRIAGWDRLAQQAHQAARQDGAAFIACEEYGTAALLAWWSAPQDAPPVWGAGPRWSLVALPRIRPDQTAPGRSGLLLQSARRREPPDPALWLSAQPLAPLDRGAGPAAESFRLYRVVLRPGAPAALLPGRP